jgi:hypothetical protein
VDVEAIAVGQNLADHRVDAAAVHRRELRHSCRRSWRNTDHGGAIDPATDADATARVKQTRAMVRRLISMPSFAGSGDGVRGLMRRLSVSMAPLPSLTTQ